MIPEPISLYPEGYNVIEANFYLDVRLNVQKGGIAITIAKINLVGKHIFILARPMKGFERGTVFMCFENSSITGLSVNLPHNVNEKDVKIHNYFLGKDFDFDGKSNKHLTFIDDEVEYINALKKGY